LIEKARCSLQDRGKIYATLSEWHTNFRGWESDL
jgi:hypothetical protein